MGWACWHAASARPPRLLVDRGEGFTDAGAITLPYPRADRLRTLLRLPPGIVGLRLQLPGGLPREVAARELGSAEAFA